MLIKTKRLIQANKSIVSNFSYLSLIQILNLLIPFITYPYLIRTLGSDTYGTVVYAQAVINYLLIIVNFGFNLSAIKNVSVNRNDKEKLCEVISSTLILKFLLFIIAIIILLIACIVIPELYEIRLLLILTMWVCLYDLIFPIWYFQGIEQMSYLAIINAISRLSFLPLIFFLIESSNDYLFVPVLNGVGAIVAGGIAGYIVFFRHKLTFRFIPGHILLSYLKDSLPYFVTNLSSKIYVTANKLIVGSFLGMSEVAYYDLAEKLINLLKTPQSLLTQVLFPKLTKEQNPEIIKKSLKVTIGLNVGLSVIAFLFAEPIILFLGGGNMLQSVSVFRLLLLTVPIIGLSSVYGLQVLVTLGFPKVYRNVVTIALVVFSLAFVVLWFYGIVNLYTLCLLVIVSELSVTILTYLQVKKRKLL